MITQPSVLNPESNEYFQLKVTCQIFDELTEDMFFEIRDIYFDMGQDWMWTTIVAYNYRDNSSFQVLNPRDWREIINGATNSTIRDICKEAINEYPNIWNIKESKTTAEKLSMQKEERLRELIHEHNDLCDKFSKELHEIMNEINSICEPVGIIAGRIDSYKNGQSTTRIHLMPKKSSDNIDEDWLKMLWYEDDRL